MVFYYQDFGLSIIYNGIIYSNGNYLRTNIGPNDQLINLQGSSASTYKFLINLLAVQ